MSFMQSVRPIRKKLDGAKSAWRAALLAGSLLLPSAALAQERQPERPTAAHQERHEGGDEAGEHRHPESERFSPGPLLIMRSSAYRVAGALHEDMINPRAVVPFSSGVSATYNLQENTHSFFNYMLDSGHRDFSPRLLSLTVSAQYDLFRFRDLVLHRNETAGTEEEHELTGIGHAVSLTPALAFGGGISGIPVEFVVFGNFGYRNWSSARQMTFSDGTSGSVGMSSSEGYVGLYGFEMRFPTVPCEPAFPVRLERFGVGMFGEPQNILAYFTVSGNYLANHRARLRTLLTPQFSNFAEELNVGGELIPLELTFYLRHGLISIAPGLRAEYNFTANIPVLEAFGDIRYFPVHQVGFALRGGWIGDVSGRHHPHGEPSSGFGSVNMIFNIDGPGLNAPVRSDMAHRGG